MKSHLQQEIESELISSIGCAIKSLATPDFYENLFKLCSAIFPFDRGAIFILNRDSRPIILHESVNSERVPSVPDDWLDGAYLLDPFYNLFDTDQIDGVYELSDIAPDEFLASDYYKSYYLAVGIQSETGLLLKLDDSNSCLLVLGRNSKDPLPIEGKIKLSHYAEIVMSLCVRHQTAANGEVTFSAPLDRAFRNFGKDHLSARECEVVQLLLKGHSNKSIANLLSISVDTVKVYNKRFHTKLDVTSQAELFSLFLESIALVPFDADIDPLTHYREIGRPKNGSAQ